MNSVKRIKKYLNANPLIQKILSDDHCQNRISLLASVAFDLLYAIWEILCGIFCHSYWFLTLGCYYLLLMLARFILLQETSEHRKNAGWKRYRACGVLLLLMNFILSGMVVLAMTDNNASHYAGYLIYAMAAYTFCKTGVAIKNVIRHRNPHNPILTASKVISFVSALISILSLEIAMVQRFGDDKDFFMTMTVLTGSGVCVIISAMAVRMIRSNTGI